MNLNLKLPMKLNLMPDQSLSIFLFLQDHFTNQFHFGEHFYSDRLKAPTLDHFADLYYYSYYEIRFVV